MSEQKQLTVAEILAKAQQENPEAGTHRRRRRSLEDGGVSVAELTGSLKKVEAKPVEARHSSVPIDAPEPKVEKPKAAGSTRYVPPAPKEEAPKAETLKPSREQPAGDETTVLRKVAAPQPERVESEVQVREPAPSMAETSPNAVPVVDVSADDTDSAVDTTSADDFDEFLEPETVPADEIVVEEEGVNPILLVLLVFLGVLVGVAGFLLFQWLWANTAAVVAAVLGVAAVAGAIFGARALGTGRDWLTAALAGIAAIVVAFGPALL